MPKINFDFNPHFWIGLAIFVTTAISSGTIHLTNAIPEVAIPYVVAWSSIISIVGSGYLTAALGLHNASPEAKQQAAANVPNTMVVTTDRPITPEIATRIAAVPGTQKVISTPEVAAATPSDKVVSTGEHDG
jgi:hypothetical protein